MNLVTNGNFALWNQGTSFADQVLADESAPTLLADGWYLVGKSADATTRFTVVQSPTPITTTTIPVVPGGDLYRLSLLKQTGNLGTDVDDFCAIYTKLVGPWNPTLVSGQHALLSFWAIGSGTIAAAIHPETALGDGSMPQAIAAQVFNLRPADDKSIPLRKYVMDVAFPVAISDTYRLYLYIVAATNRAARYGALNCQFQKAAGVNVISFTHVKLTIPEEVELVAANAPIVT